jgi:hypothetical protein
MDKVKDLRYQMMLALYFPILLYAFSTFDLSEDVYVVDAVEPVVVAEQTVVLGQPFEARAFLAVAGSERPTLSGQNGLEVLGDSLFRMGTGALLAEDQSEAEIAYSGAFAFQQIGGATSRIPVTGSFTVRRPEIVAQSEATSALYRQSRNALRIEVPGLEDRQLRLEVGDRRVDGRSVTLSPAGDGATVRVFLAGEDGADDVFLGTKSFTAIDPPRPEIRVSHAGRELRNGDNLPRARAALSFQIVPDEQFRVRFPQDARYGAGRARVYLRQGLAASRDLGTFSLDGGQLVLTSALREARPGDRVTVVLEGVHRINHAGQAIRVPFSPGSLTFGFVIT